MAVMRTVGCHPLPPHARVREGDTQYVIELDVAEFTNAELSVEVAGPLVTVRGDQVETPADDGKPFLLHERLEESFRLPDDAELDQIKAFYSRGTLELRVGRTPLAPRRLRIERRRSGLLDPDAEGV